MKILIFFMFIYSTIAASDSLPVEKKELNRAGILLIAPYGIELSYRRSLFDKFGIEGGGMLFSHYNKFSGRIQGQDHAWYFSLFMIGDYTWREYRFIRVFQYIDAAYFYTGRMDNERVMIDSISYPYYKKESVTHDILFGDGLGLEIKVWKIGLNLSSGLCWGYSFQTNNLIPFKIAFKTGLFYRF